MSIQCLCSHPYLTLSTTHISQACQSGPSESHQWTFSPSAPTWVVSSWVVVYNLHCCLLLPSLTSLFPKIFPPEFPFLLLVLKNFLILLLPLCCPFTFSLTLSQSLHTHSWSVPIPSSVSGLLVVHINYTFLSVYCYFWVGKFFGEGGVRKERVLFSAISYYPSFSFFLILWLPFSLFYFLDNQLKLKGFFFSNPHPNVMSSV